MKILIIEDEPQTASILKDIILQLRPDGLILDIIGSIEKTITFFKTAKQQPDLVFMDIQLSDGLSFNIFSQVEIKSPVIFCTAYDQFTLQAFKNNGIDYILKPVKEEDVKAAFMKFETLKQAILPDQQLLNSIKTLMEQNRNYKTSILIRYKESYIPVAISDIALFFVDSEIVFAHTFDNHKYAVFKTMGEIENDINPSEFYRINRQVLLSRKAIKEIQPFFNRKVIIKTNLKFDEQLIVSRLKVTDFLNWVEQA